MKLGLKRIDVKIGQRVIIKDGRYGRTQEGVITKIGTKWIDIQPEEHSNSNFTLKYRLDTQNDGSGYSGRGHFYTLEQWEKREREKEATAYLCEQGITIEHHSKIWKGREIELADIIRAATATDTEGGD